MTGVLAAGSRGVLSSLSPWSSLVGVRAGPMGKGSYVKVGTSRYKEEQKVRVGARHSSY